MSTTLRFCSNFLQFFTIFSLCYSLSACVGNGGDGDSTSTTTDTTSNPTTTTIEDNADFVKQEVDLTNINASQTVKTSLETFITDIAPALNNLLKLPKGKDIKLSFIDCDIINAFYDPNTQQVTICNELFNDVANIYSGYGADFSYNAALATHYFVFFHELGHALVDQLDLAVLGGEESNVDAIATVFMVEGGFAASPIFAGFYFQASPDTPWFDSHPADMQRMGNLVCWAIGGDPSLLLRNEILNDFAKLFISSNRDCEAEYVQAKTSTEKLLDPYLKQTLQEWFADSN